jgi:hypothetical protein
MAMKARQAALTAVALAKVVEDTLEEALDNTAKEADEQPVPPEPPKSPTPARGGLKRVK